ncbi:MAG: helix-turn-helix domain-containing protein [Sedimentisphaerales bacterium]|nr:helix-turn-helix domain-containing protein [Sedimentisphaerales bacterium]
MSEKKQKSLPFVKAYTFLLEKKDLKPAEKLVLFTVCRFWPQPCWHSNATIAEIVGFSVRWVEKVLKSLKTKGYIKAGYAHRQKEGKYDTLRIIRPACLPGKCQMPDNITFKEPDLSAGIATDLQTGQPPTNQSQMTDLQTDLLERNRRENRKATPLPLPVAEQAKALEDQQSSSGTERVSYSEVIGQKILRRVPQLTPQEFDRRRREQIKALLADS